MRKYRVVEEYFDLLFNEDTVVTGSNDVRERPLPKGYQNSRSKFGISRTSSINSAFDATRSLGSQGVSSTTDDSLKDSFKDEHRNGNHQSNSNHRMTPDTIPESENENSGPNSPDNDDDEIDELCLRSSVSALPPPPLLKGAKDLENQDKTPTGPLLTFTEFLRVNMRLAEDRVLSFVTVFSTGFGTKWIPGATFYYEPEVTFQTLLTQRRRWINGTVASFMYFFSSKRARLRVSGGFFDSHKAGKSLRLVNALWALNLLQFVFVLISPSVFGVALYNGLKNGARFSPAFDWAKYIVFDIGGPFGEIDVAVIITALYLLIYVLWTMNAFVVKGGKVPEW
eukprot:CAMPEP_0174819640 /NCGR_PEP_ID=MMETSP1107-20130205/3001_1 /TAXON_ID=36770 /ORGANISM="Paraphysomonas vestita, Strain GFlagA" /LENGTH=338 /DNA_ID=CAMNT_0016033529 /DNA_START=1104 /DNA_END=2117 /DNA_ORIENTATION=-